MMIGRHASGAPARRISKSLLPKTVSGRLNNSSPPSELSNSDRINLDPGAYLVLRSAGRWSDVFRLLPPEEAVIGRSSSNQIVLKDQQASRHHAKVWWNGQGWILSDLGSVNGTFLNQSPIEGDCQLTDRDTIHVGGFEIVFSKQMDGLTPESTDRSQSSQVTDDQMTIEIDADAITDRRRFSSYLNPSNDFQSATDPFDARVDAVGGHRPNGKSIKNAEEGAHRLLQLAFQLARCEEPIKAIEATLEDFANHLQFDTAGFYLSKSVKSGQSKTEMSLVATRQVGKRSYRRPPESLMMMVTSPDSEAVLARNVLGDPEVATENSRGEIDVESVILAPMRDRSGLQRGVIHLTTTRGSRPLGSQDLEYIVAAGQILTASLVNLADRRKLAKSLRQTRQQVKQLQQLLGDKVRIVGNSDAIQSLVEQIGLAAPTSATVLVRGESGVGKELVAAAIHHASDRSDGPLICMNCAALSPSLLESELFGHEKGAFTGATERKRGKFELADGGTLMLDEIGEMDTEIQAKFLRVLEGHPFERVGGHEAIRVNVRVVAATNRNLQQMVQENQFRQDLYYRLHVVELLIPPLRNRGKDCLLIAEHFLGQLNQQMGRKITGFTDSATKKMMAYQWPGNIRELRNVVERAVVLNQKDEIDASDLSLSPASSKAEGVSEVEDNPEITLADLEKRHIDRVLRHTDGNKSRAALILGIERSTLDRKLKRYQKSDQGRS